MAVKSKDQGCHRTTMSLPQHARVPSSSKARRRQSSGHLDSLSAAIGVRKPTVLRRTSVSGLAGSSKAQRTSKTSQKLVVLPSAPQTKPIDEDEDPTLGYETDAGPVREYKREGEKMNKEQRKRAGYRRLTAYCVAHSFKMQLLSSFLKREHNVVPRVFDEALYAVCRESYFFVKHSTLARCTISLCFQATVPSQTSAHR